MNTKTRQIDAHHRQEAATSSRPPSGRAFSFSRRRFAAVAFAALLSATRFASAQATPPYPPTVLVNGTLMTGAFGSYSTTNYNGNGAPASLSIVGTGVGLGVSVGYWTEPYLLSGGYWSAGYWSSPGYWIPGYWAVAPTDEDGDGNFEGGEWVRDLWVDGVWVDGDWVPEEWAPAAWVQTGNWNDTGTYAHFAFQMTGGTAVQPADSNGVAWTQNPRSGIPEVLVDGIRYFFRAADATAGYDYYTPAGGDGYFWLEAPGQPPAPETACAGYHSQLGMFSGVNHNGFMVCTTPDPDGPGPETGTPVSVFPRNGDGQFLAFGAPIYGGPDLIWSDGLAFRFLTTDTVTACDVYLQETSGHVFVHDGGVVTGLVIGRIASSAFQASPTPKATFSGETDGTPLPTGSAPVWGPPALFVTNQVWRYRGSTATADYYGGERPRQCLSIGANGAVAYTDGSLNFYDVPGLYTGGVFQNLPVSIRGVVPVRGPGANDLRADPWSSRPTANASYPEAITVNGQPWYYSNTSGQPTYLGPQSGQILTINGTGAVLSDPARGLLNLMGHFVNGKFTFDGDLISVNKAKADGTPDDADGSDNYVAGNLDVSGNTFTLGSWHVGENSFNGFSLSFDDGQHLLNFNAVRAGTDWRWSTESVERMRIKASGNVGIGTSAPEEKLHVQGNLKVNGVIRTDRAAGDISMGGFHYPDP